MANSGLYVQGKNVHVFKYIGVVPFEIVCGTDVVYERTKELIGATTPDSGKNKEIRPRLKEATITISGITTSDNDGDLSIFHFMDETVEDEPQDLEIVFTDNNINKTSLWGIFYIENLNISGPADASSPYEIVLRSSGEITTSTLVDPTVTGESVKSDTYTVASGIVSDSEWIGLSATNIIGVWREGTELTSMGLSYSVNFTTGEITPDASTTFDGQRIFVIWTY